MSTSLDGSIKLEGVAMQNFYSNKMVEGYFAHSRAEMLPFVPDGVMKVLDVGCGEGGFGALLKESRGAEVVGIEMNVESATKAERVLDRVSCASASNFAFRELGLFDCIVFNDVLEHLEDPWEVLVAARHALSPAGHVVISLPNVRFFPVLYNLIAQGDWKYEDSGVLDKTHLRFFTRKSIVEMLSSAGFRVVKLEGLNWENTPLYVRALNRLFRGKFHDLSYPQFAILAAPSIR